jgi:hypothetical protein
MIQKAINHIGAAVSTPSERDPTLPWAKAQLTPDAREKLKRVIAKRGLCGLANDTKWDEFLAEMRPRAKGQQCWRFSWRCKSVTGFMQKEWEQEWFYHLPFPFMGVEWLDVFFVEEIRDQRVPSRVDVIDHSPWLEEMLKRVGLDYRKGQCMVRIFGYSPRDLELFDVENATGGR